MIPERSAPAGAAALLLVSILTGCSPAEPDFASLAEQLRQDPVGDRGWREALRLAPETDNVPALIALAEEVSGKYPDRWEPRWARAKLMRDEDPEGAIKLFRVAHRLAVLLGDDDGIASCANDLGWMDFLVGRLDEGRRWYGIGIDAARTAGRNDLEAFLRNNLAGLYMRTGEFALARDELELAQAGLKELGLSQAARWAAQNRAAILLELGDATGARDLLQALHEEAVDAEDAWTLDASAVILGGLAAAQDRPAEARAWYERVSRTIPELEDGADFGLGRLALIEGHDAEALEILNRAAERVRPRHATRALNFESYAARATAGMGRTGQAQRELERIVRESDETDAGESRWTARSFLGKLLLELDRPEDAIPVLEEAVEILERQSAPFDPMGEGLHFLRERTEPYVSLALALARSKREDREARILEVAGRVQARALSEAVDPPSLAALQRSLSSGEMLLDYLIGEEAGMLLAVGPREAHALSIPGRRTLAEPLERYRRALSELSDEGQDEAVRREGLRLRRALIDPLADRLASARRLYIVPDRELALLPFAALPTDEGRHLGDVVETAILPRAGAPPSWENARTPVLLAGHPLFDSDSEFGELPWAAYELSRIGEVWGPDRADYIGQADFSRETLLASGLDSFRTIHLATHAEASTRDPRRCGVILSGGEKLGLAEIAALDLSGSLVVLSACRTGEGELLPGQGVIGLGWAFLRAGARGIVVSLWPVDDVAAARLMVAFHEELREGRDPVRALTLARRRLSAEQPNPGLWAPFILVLRPS